MSVCLSSCSTEIKTRQKPLTRIQCSHKRFDFSQKLTHTHTHTHTHTRFPHTWDFLALTVFLPDIYIYKKAYTELQLQDARRTLVVYRLLRSSPQTGTPIGTQTSAGSLTLKSYDFSSFTSGVGCSLPRAREFKPALQRTKWSNECTVHISTCSLWGGVINLFWSWRN